MVTKTISHKMLNNAEVLEMCRGLGKPPEQLTAQDHELRARATSHGYLQSGTLTLTAMGRARAIRISALPKEKPAATGRGGSSGFQVSVFRKNDFLNFVEASESGALYPISLPFGKVTTWDTLQKLHGAVRATADSIGGNPDAFDVVAHNKSSHQLLTDKLNSEALKAPEFHPETETVLEVFEKMVARNQPDSGAEYSLVIHRMHEYGDSIGALYEAERDGALRWLPINVSDLSGVMNEEKWELLAAIEQSVKNAASCLDGNTDMVLAIAHRPFDNVPATFVTMEQLKDAYTTFELTPHCDGSEHFPLFSAFAHAVTLRREAASEMLPAHLVSYAEKAAQVFFDIAAATPQMPWKDMIDSIRQHAPQEIAENAGELLQLALPKALYSEIGFATSFQSEPAFMEKKKALMSTLLLTTMSEEINPVPTLNRAQKELPQSPQETIHRKSKLFLLLVVLHCII